MEPLPGEPSPTEHPPVEIVEMTPGDVDRLVAASALFDHPVGPEWAGAFLDRDGHHLLMASADGLDVGFITGIEITHPDKGTEMLLYELGVDDASRRRGIGRALVEALIALARGIGCVGMWVPTETDNVAALATYRSAGADAPEPGVVLAWTFD